MPTSEQLRAAGAPGNPSSPALDELRAIREQLEQITVLLRSVLVMTRDGNAVATLPSGLDEIPG